MLALTPIAGSLSDPSRRLLTPGLLGAGVTLLRAQVTGQALALGTDDATWQALASDVPRFNGSARRLLVGGQRTNAVTNPRAEGGTVGVVGSGGAAPTGWTVNGAGVTTEIVALGTMLGLPSVTIRYSAASAPATIIQNFPGATSAISGELMAASVVTRLSAGSLTNVTGVTLSTNGASSVASPTGTANRVSSTRTASGAAHTMSYRFACTAASPVELTIEYAAPSFEIGAFASTPILPAVGAPAASTRGADLVSASLSALGIGANGACTILGTAMLPQNAPAGVNQMIVNVDGGTDTNRFRLHNVAGGATLVAGRVLAGVLADATSAGSMTAGTLFRWGLSIDGAGRIASCVNGGTVQAATGGPTSGLTTLRVGNNAAGTAPMFGEVGGLRLLPFALPDAALQTAVSAMT